MSENTFDIIVLGAGPAGYSAAIRAAQLKARVLLVDKGSFGGTCLNYGCIPTKFLWESTALAKKIRRAADFGIDAEIKSHSFTALQGKKNRATGLLQKGLIRLFDSYGIEVVEGAACFAAPHDITIAKKDGASLTVTGKSIIIATGSTPRGLPGISIDHAGVIDSTDALNLAEVPAKLLIIGGGAIGVEMATIFSTFGSQVMLVEREKQLLPGEDADLAGEVRKTLERAGVHVETAVNSCNDLLPRFDKVLLVTGRRPCIEGLALDKGGVAATPRGITVNEYLQTSAGNIYAAGDAAGNCYLAYTAQAEGIIAAENACGAKNIPDYAAVPRVVFSQPPAASVGVREASAGTVVGRFPLTANSRAFIEGERAGWVKLFSDKASRRVLGGQVMGPHAEDLIAVISLAVRHQLTLDDLRRELFFHPSLSEAIHAAAEDSSGSCVDLPKKT